MQVQRTGRGGGHRSGKLVVIAMIALGVLLGMAALLFRKHMPSRPTTQPTSLPVAGRPASQPS